MLARDQHDVTLVSRLLVRPTLQAGLLKVLLAVAVLLFMHWEQVCKQDINKNRDLKNPFALHSWLPLLVLRRFVSFSLCFLLSVRLLSLS